MANNLSGVSVAELFASLGIDSTGFSEGLKKARVDMTGAAQSMRTDVQLINNTLTQLGENPSGRALQQAMRGVAQSIREASVASQEFMRVEREAAAMDALHARQRLADVRALNAEFSQAIRHREAVYGPDEGTPAAGMGMAGRTLGRFALYAGAYGAARFAGSALRRPIDIERQSEQTGMSGEDVQRLQFAAARTGTPVESMMSGIARLQERIETEQPKALAALQELKIPAKDFQRLMEQDVAGAISTVMLAINKLDSQSKQVQVFQDLFGGRGGRQREAMNEFADKSTEALILTQEQRDAVRDLSVWWETSLLKGEAYFAMLASHLVKGASSTSGVAHLVGEAALLGMHGVGGPLGIAASAFEQASSGGSSVTMPTPPSSPTSLGLKLAAPLEMKNFGNNRAGNANWALLMKEQADLQKQARDSMIQNRREAGEHTSILDAFMPEGERNLYHLRDQMQKALELYRDGVMTRQELDQAAAGYRTRVEEEQEKAEEDRIRRTEHHTREATSALSHFKVTGQSTALVAQFDLNRVWRSYREGKVTLDELTRAQREYNRELFEMGRGTKLSLREALLRGENDQVLRRIRDRETSEGLLGEDESSFLHGDIDARQLRRSYQIFRDQDDRSRVDIPNLNYGRNPRPTSEGGVSINVIPMDQFSESMLRRWKQEGLMTA